MVRDFDDVTCLSEFRFHKQDLQRLANLLWPWLAVDLPGVREAVAVKNKYRVPFETGLLLVLYHFARPHKIHGNMETFLGMRRSHICATISTFVDALYNFSFKFLNNPAIYKPRIPNKKLVSSITFGGSSTEPFARLVDQPHTNESYTVVTNVPTDSSFSQL